MPGDCERLPAEPERAGGPFTSVRLRNKGLEHFLRWLLRQVDALVRDGDSDGAGFGWPVTSIREGGVRPGYGSVDGWAAESAQAT